MNFSFLETITGFEKLLKYCNDAELLVNDFPEASAISSRKAMEYMTKLIYGLYVDASPNSLTVYEMQVDQKFIKSINSKELMDYFHYIRLIGNDAAHLKNVTKENAKLSLKKLHTLIGDLSIQIGIIDSYPPFTDALQQLSMSVISDQTEPEVDQTIFSRLTSINRIRHPELLNPDFASPTIVNQHLSPKRMGTLKQEKTDFVASSTSVNTSIAFQQIAQYLEQSIGCEQLSVDYAKKNITIIQKNGVSKTLAIRTGCGRVATLGFNNEWIYMPGIDYVLYTIALSADVPIIEQFHVFSKDQYIEMWQETGFLHKKLSKSRHDMLTRTLPKEVNITVHEYADELSIQTISTAKRSRIDDLNSRINSMPSLQNYDFSSFKDSMQY